MASFVRTLLLLLASLAILSQPGDANTTPHPRMLTRARKRCNRTRFATLNCRTLLADETLADLDATLTDHNIALCALQETRRDGFTSMCTTNYKIYWFGECSGHRGVGFALHKSYLHLVKAVHPVPGSGGRIITMDILLSDNTNHTTIICAYSPPNTSSNRTRDKFYSQLRTVAKPSAWMMGDFNARVGRCVTSTGADADVAAETSATVGPMSLKGDITPNANGSLLLDIAGENNYRHLSSHFTCRDSKRWTWRHPRYHTRAVLDHIFVPSSQLRNITRYFVAQQTVIHTDHRLAICESTFRPRLEKRGTKRPAMVDKSALLNPGVCDNFQAEVTNLLGESDPLAMPTEELSNKIRTVPVIAAESVLPPKVKPKYPEEFTAATVDMIRQKRGM